MFLCIQALVLIKISIESRLQYIDIIVYLRNIYIYIYPSRSDVFRAMLVNDMREKATKQINLVDIDPDIFKVPLAAL